MSRITRQLRGLPERTGDGAKIVLVAGAYFATAKLGLELAFEHASITAVWPPTGISLAALVIWGYRHVARASRWAPRSPTRSPGTCRP